MKPATEIHVLNEHSKKLVINGQRSSPLIINKNSHLIHKPSSYSSKPHKQERNPIIIYMQSPKIIHTKPQDFRALVQKLTGMTPTKKNVVDVTASLGQHQPLHEASENLVSSLSYDSNNSIKLQEYETSSGSLTHDSETCVKEESHVQDNHSNILGFSDMPLFTTDSSDFHFSSRSVYKYSDSPYGILGSLLSPTGLEFMKELPEY
ncbi:hypothetical protein TanjilG_28755 [Lupinus angustifolius]|uniref:VQ domain-containing protein n=1 Tax=Lupinus angustifolius TaxID=3871 RepID=A0A1J7HV56_LUPAN|nr:PREDICTED: VQ motif-containing protein 8, chloroplastic-like [Lupinus angustifolius]OIW16698.1 hypothetical protein TanjilG_28755 [Lupinus angustifolius]